LAAALAPIAERDGLELIEGKMVLELVPAGASRKGGVVEAILERSGARFALYAGDDLPDIEAFEALDRAIVAGTLAAAVKVAVKGPETPEELVTRADVVVEGPAGLVALLGQLSRPGTTPGA
jgi:trehalose 6-phosphate phosphatase